MKTGKGYGSIPTMIIKDQAMLYSVYMPFLKNGGLFMPTTQKYKLGEEVFFLLKLMDEPQDIPVSGTVAWMTPIGAQGRRSAGIGVHFSDQEGAEVRKLIEHYLAGTLDSDRPTQTL